MFSLSFKICLTPFHVYPYQSITNCLRIYFFLIMSLNIFMFSSLAPTAIPMPLSLCLTNIHPLLLILLKDLVAITPVPIIFSELLASLFVSTLTPILLFKCLSCCILIDNVISKHSELEDKGMLASVDSDTDEFVSKMRLLSDFVVTFFFLTNTFIV